jgi:hypothetical protein
MSAGRGGGDWVADMAYAERMHGLWPERGEKRREEECVDEEQVVGDSE